MSPWLKYLSVNSLALLVLKRNDLVRPASSEAADINTPFIVHRKVNHFKGNHIELGLGFVECQPGFVE